MKELSRRSFLKGAGASALAAALTTRGAAGLAEQESITYADTIAWDGAYDVVVIGFGLAGGTAAYFAAKNGSNVLLIDKAPEGNEGGNSRYAGQCIVHGSNYEQLEAYYRKMFAHYNIPEDSFKAYVDGAYEVLDMVKNDMGFEGVYSMKEIGVAGFYTPEYPEFPGSETMDMYLVSPNVGDGELWKGIKRRVDDAELIDVWYGCPGKHLIQDPVSKTVIGVEIERNGEIVRIRANNGVVLSTGGYENNPQMLQDYLNITRWSLGGTTYNTGDGVHMAQEVGADLWHMNTWEGRGQLFGGMSFPVANGERGVMVDSSNFNVGSIMLVGASGTRYLPEDEKARHGHVYAHGVWENPDYPSVSYAVFDQKKYEQILAEGLIGEAFLPQIVSGATLAELAEKTGMVAAELEEQVSRFNFFAENGKDYQFGRSADTMAAFDAEGPYYAIEMVIGMLNTQGGPRRNPQGEILFPDGSVIPHLYSAGELGGTICVQYQGGGNMMECLMYGKRAGENAAKKKEPLPALTTEAVASNLLYTIDAEYDRGEAKSWQQRTLADNEFIGVGQGMGGDVVVLVTFSETASGDGKTGLNSIVNIEVLEHHETEGIGDLAFEQMPQRFIDANSADVDVVATATMTSNALIEAVRSAIEQHDAKKKV